VQIRVHKRFRMCGLLISVFVTPLECAFIKKGGWGTPLGCSIYMKNKARSGEQSPRTVRCGACEVRHVSEKEARSTMPPHKRRIQILLLAGGSELTRVACRAYTEALSLCFREPLPVIESSKEKPSWNSPSF
jgi:hypothetical protein